MFSFSAISLIGHSCGLVVAGRGRSERASRAVEGVRRNVFLLAIAAVDAVTVTSTTHGRYTVCTFIYNPITIHTPLVLDCPHSQRTLRTSVRKLHTLVLKCLLLQHPHNSPLRPASPRPPCRAILRQSLACPGDATSSPSPWLQLSLLHQEGCQGNLEMFTYIAHLTLKMIRS